MHIFYPLYNRIKLLMNLYKKCGKVEVEGVNKVVYSKTGTKKKYVVYKKRHISLTKYKKIKANNKKEKHSNKRNNKSGGLGTNFFSRNINKKPRDFHPEGDSSSRFRLPSISMNPAKWFSTPTKKPKDSQLNATTTRDDARKQSQQEKEYRRSYNRAWYNLRISLDNNPDIILLERVSFFEYLIIKRNEQIFQQIIDCAILKGCAQYFKNEDLDYNTRIRDAVNTVKKEIYISFDKDKPSNLSLFINKNGNLEDEGYINRVSYSLTENLTEYFMKKFPRKSSDFYDRISSPSLFSYNAPPSLRGWGGEGRARGTPRSQLRSSTMSKALAKSRNHPKGGGVL